jgi:hypothetical protein
VAIHRRRQHLQWHDLDSLHAGEFAIDALASDCRRIRRERQSLGESIKHRRGANHDRQRTDPNADANSQPNRDSNCHTDNYSKSDTNGNSHCNANRNRNTDGYYYAYSEAYPITEASFYTAASANPATENVIPLSV